MNININRIQPNNHRTRSRSPIHKTIESKKISFSLLLSRELTTLLLNRHKVSHVAISYIPSDVARSHSVECERNNHSALDSTVVRFTRPKIISFHLKIYNKRIDSTLIATTFVVTVDKLRIEILC